MMMNKGPAERGPLMVSAARPPGRPIMLPGLAGRLGHRWLILNV